MTSLRHDVQIKLDIVTSSSRSTLLTVRSSGLGTIGLATIYAALLCSCMFLPSLVIKRLSCKWTMVACTLCYSTYMLAQLYPRTYTIVPGAIVLGLGAAPMWSAKCTYFTQVLTWWWSTMREAFMFEVHVR